MKVFIVMMAVVLLTACGQKGDLYLPDHPNQQGGTFLLKKDTSTLLPTEKTQ